MSIIKSTLVALTLTVVAVPAYAEQPEWGGEGRRCGHGECMMKKGMAGERFKELDKDGDGKISQEELAAGGKGKWQEKFEDHFNKRDLNGDGKITKEEAIAAHKKKMAEKFKKADKDGDGYISKDEMKNLRNHKKGGMKRHMRRQDRDGGAE